MRRYLFPTLFILVIAIVILYYYGRSLWYPVYAEMTGGRSISEVIKHYEQDPQKRLKQRFDAANVPFRNTDVTLIGLKEEKQLELWVKHNDAWQFIHSYPVTAASGIAGPKLREGDRQVPEGIYQITWLNPNSSYHLSMKINYPNAFDLKHAIAEGRNEPGSDIFIHGKAVSIGCIAVGDDAIDELFGLVHSVGKDRVTVIITPHDARKRSLFPVDAKHADWVKDLYQKIELAIGVYKR